MHEHSRRFFLRLAFADIVTDRETGLRYLDPLFSPTPTHEAKYADALRLASYVSPILFGDPIDSPMWKTSSDDTKRDVVPYKEGYGMVTRRKHIQMAPAFGKFFNHPYFDHIDATKVREVSFLLAVTLVHEHAHLVWQMRRYNTKLQPYWVESDVFDSPNDPEFDPQKPSAEMGFTWENFSIGPIVKPYSIAAVAGQDTLRANWADDRFFTHLVFYDWDKGVYGEERSTDLDVPRLFFNWRLWDKVVPATDQEVQTRLSLRYTWGRAIAALKHASHLLNEAEPLIDHAAIAERVQRAEDAHSQHWSQK